MLCPRCKNPIDDYSITCEWCGAIINTEKYQRQEEAAIAKDTALTGGKLGIIALICGSFGILLIPIPVAIACGILGWGKKKKNRKLAIAGFILACLWTALFIYTGFIEQ